ncbi:MAG: hypothetical protein WC325_07660 [Candidatus Bathyarchaeia archaeon]|jgi:hypothetical protein
MTKIGVAVLLIVIVAFLAATVIGYQNGLNSNTQDTTTEQSEQPQNGFVQYTLAEHQELDNLTVHPSWMETNLSPGTVVKTGYTLK